MLSNEDRYGLARALAGLAPVEDLPLSPLARMLVDNLRGRIPGPEEVETARRFFGQDFITQVFAVDPNAAPPAREDTSPVPPLPKYAQLPAEWSEKARLAGRWLDGFNRWAKQRATMTDPLFLEAGGLWLLALAVARRAVLRLDFDDIYPNLYVLWVAGTTYYRKSTGLRAVEHVVRNVIPHMLMASQNSPELLIHKMAGKATPNFSDLTFAQQELERAGARFAGQRGFITDEAAKLFRKKYMETLPELLMEAYDCPPVMEQEFKTQGKLIVQQPGPSLLFATTPASLQSIFEDGEWEDGLLPRFALLTPAQETVKRVHARRYAPHINPSTDVLVGLRQLYERLPMPPAADDVFEADRLPLDPQEVSICDLALERFNLYADAMHEMTAPRFGLDNRLRGVYGRLPVMALKIAMNLCLADWAQLIESEPKISGAHWARAQQIVESWRPSAHRLLDELNRSLDQRVEDRIIEFITRHEKKLPSEYEIYRGAQIGLRRDAYSAIDALLKAGKIIKVDTGSRQGYRLNQESA